MSRKIIIFYTPYGAGHRQAAKAIQEQFRRIGEDAEIKNSLSFIPSFIAKSCVGGYDVLIKYLLPVWAFLYVLTDIKLFAPFFRTLRRLYNGLAYKRLVEFIKEQSPDVIICTHFLPEEIVCSMKRKKQYKGKIIVCVTDLRVHSFWITPGADSYIVGSVEGKKDLLRWGVQNEKINLFGIPIHPAFSLKPNRQEMCKKFNIQDNMFTVLVTSGGFGVGPVKRIVQSLAKMKDELQIVVVCGRSPKLFRNLTGFAKKAEKKIHVFEFINNMYEVMSIADIIISKAGGLTVAEALAKRLPIIVARPLSGQEIKNTEILVSNNAGIRVYNVQQVIERVRFLIENTDHLLRMKQNIEKLRKPDSTKDICNFVLEKN
jgi:processive 1,2-diacylglycerol beta-glucosyltransferase